MALYAQRGRPRRPDGIARRGERRKHREILPAGGGAKLTKAPVTPRSAAPVVTHRYAAAASRH